MTKNVLVVKTHYHEHTFPVLAKKTKYIHVNYNNVSVSLHMLLITFPFVSLVTFYFFSF